MAETHTANKYNVAVRVASYAMESTPGTEVVGIDTGWFLLELSHPKHYDSFNVAWRDRGMYVMVGNEQYISPIYTGTEDEQVKAIESLWSSFDAGNLS